jgi:hypothetical protein
VTKWKLPDRFSARQRTRMASPIRSTPFVQALMQDVMLQCTMLSENVFVRLISGIAVHHSVPGNAG